MSSIHHHQSPRAEHICLIWHQGGRELALNTKWLLLPGALSQPYLPDTPQRELPTCSRQTPHLGYSHDAPVAYQLWCAPSRDAELGSQDQWVVQGLFNGPAL